MINFFKNKAKKVEYLAGILLKQEEGITYLFTVDSDKKLISLLEQRSFKYTGGWENLLYDVDGILFNFENDYSIRVKKSIFFVYSHLVDRETGELRSTYLDALTAVVKENDLETLGYFELDELLSRSYLKIEQDPLNAMFVEVDSSAVSVYVYQAGKRTFADSVAKTQDIITDIEEIFTHLPSTLKLPPRIIVYDSSPFQAETDALLVHKWNKDVFIQLPKVDIVKDHELMQALDIAVSERVFGESSASQMQMPSVPTIRQSMDAAIDLPVASSASDSESVMGFAIGTDIASGSAIASPTPLPVEDQESVNTFYPRHESDHTSNSDMSGEIPDHFVPQSPAGNSQYSNKKIGIMHTIASFKSKINMDFLKGKGLLISSIVVVVLIIAGAVYFALYRYHTAEVVLVYDSEAIEKKMSFSDNLTIDQAKQTFQVSASVPTTGTRDTGEKAKGEVTIYNADDQSRTFKKGTKLSTSDGITFTLNDDVVAEEASTTITDEGDILTSTSKVQASVTASEIGPKSNIKKDVKLTIDSLPEKTYFARTSKVFTGGTEKEIQTASKDDIATLNSEIEKQIQAKSKKFSSEASDRNIIESLTTIDKTKESFSKEIAEEADSIDANVTADVTFYSYDERTIKKSIAEEFAGEAPDGYTIASEGISYKIISAEKDEETEDIQILVQATAYPTLKLDTKAFTDEIKGKSVSMVDGIATGRYNAKSLEAIVQAPLPFLQSRIPFFSRNISVKLKSNRSQ